ncbi:MAG: DUF542 domain-containing protein [Melioribacteraceae bacterium]
MQELEQLLLSELILTYPQLQQLFELNRIDFCCNGKRTLSEAIKEKRFSASQKEKLILALGQKIAKEREINKSLLLESYSLKELTEFIIQKHHSFVVHESNEIKTLFKKVLNAHQENHPRLNEASELILKLLEELRLHLNKEESIVFPLIRYLEDCHRFKERPHLKRYKPLQKYLESMESDHQNAGSLYDKLRNSLDNYQVPSDACTSYQLLLKKIDAFEKDLHMHIHLENYVLFPKAIELEKNLLTTY